MELAERLAAIAPHPRFDEALAALDAGDVDRLRALVTADPSLLHARTNLDPQYGYFAGATLLHHVAGNPWRDRLLPPNIVEVARVLLEAGADVHAQTLGPNGGDTMGLLVTGKQASDAGVTSPLMDLLLAHGAHLDVTSDDCLDASLANHAPRAAEKMIELGAKPDLLAAAALGRMDLLRSFFDADGRLLARPRRRGREMSDRDAIGLALLYAYVREQREAVDFLLEKDGNWEMIGVNNGAVLHRAAFAGDLVMVERIIAKGASMSNRDNPFDASPLGWAAENNQAAVMAWMRAHARIDLHDAVAFGWREHVEARLREDPASVNERRDVWDIPQGTPLHWAANQNHLELAQALLDRGADPHAVAGNGFTPLDVADYMNAGDVVSLLERLGATRTGAGREAKRREAAHEATAMPKTALEPFERITNDVFDAYRTGNPDALARVENFFGEWFTHERLRAALQRQLDKPPDADISLDDVRALFARIRGFTSWAAFAESVMRPGDPEAGWGKPFYQIDERRNTLDVRAGVRDKEWDVILAVAADRKIEGLNAGGEATDRVLSRIALLDHVTRLNLGGTKRATDAGLMHLARMPQLEELDVSDYPGGRITDRGLEVLRHLPALKRFQMCWQRGISDAGIANLTYCDRLESVDLLGTPTGNGAINVLTGKRSLRRFKSGKLVTDAGLPLLHRVPAFKTWQGGEPAYSLMSPDAGPTHLLLDGPITDRGLATLAGLDGLFALSFFWHISALTPAALRPLADLRHLGFLGCEGRLCDDEAMAHIAQIPRLLMLMAQGAVASDRGFAALSRSPTLEYIWGRECPNLTGTGFRGLADMPALRGIAVSCKRVDDAALATLPQFPALRELMPMDVSDEGFRHVGRCERLEALWCMYCRTTTDRATEHLAGLTNLKIYYAGATKITDRSLEILSRMPSLETLEFWSCAGITNAGVALLAALPRLREITIDDCRNVTAAAASAFAPHVRVRVS